MSTNHPAPSPPGSDADARSAEGALGWERLGGAICGCDVTAGVAFTGKESCGVAAVPVSAAVDAAGAGGGSPVSVLPLKLARAPWKELEVAAIEIPAPPMLAVKLSWFESPGGAQ
jgi:hypothetical protein